MHIIGYFIPGKEGMMIKKYFEAMLLSPYFWFLLIILLYLSYLRFPEVFRGAARSIIKYW